MRLSDIQKRSIKVFGKGPKEQEESGIPLEQSGLYQALRRIGKRAGIDGVRLIAIDPIGACIDFGEAEITHNASPLLTCADTIERLDVDASFPNALDKVGNVAYDL